MNYEFQNHLYIFILLAVGSTSFSFAQKYRFEQNLNSKDLSYLKSAKLYIGTTGNLAYDSVFVRVAKKYWDFSEIIDTLSVKELNERIRKKENLAYITLTRVGSSNLFSSKSGVNAKSSAYAIQLNTEGGKYGNYHQYLCYSEGFEDAVDKSLFVGIQLLNSKLKEMYENQLKSISNLKSIAIARKNVFSEKTLFIPKSWLNGVTEDEFKSKYKNQVKFVEFEEFYRLIEEGNESAIYVLPLAVPAEGGFVNTHVFVEAEGHKYLGLCQKLSFSELSTNVFSSYNGTIESRHVALYSTVVSGKW